MPSICAKCTVPKAALPPARVPDGGFSETADSGVLRPLFDPVRLGSTRPAPGPRVALAGVPIADVGDIEDVTP